ncbi:protein of unknown function [Ancylobacter rudongensis]|uniref:DUF4269 domain-containing protein n=2 Tax=Ancylobacter rudongensis TaxID=177413 RepID=A0A1G4UKE7_9HYPH|nr:protein of unknown function [Ancylobacter rudongensis]
MPGRVIGPNIMTQAVRPDFATALAHSGLLAALAAFDPHVVGTPPLGLDVPTSDIDIVCCAPDFLSFTTLMWDGFRHEQCFGLRQWRSGERAVVASFTAHGWPFEVFASPRPVAQQAGWRHFRIEKRLLELGGAALRRQVMARRRAGAKTEPAFAQVLGLAGDAYAALLDLEDVSDTALRRLIVGAAG